jgi:hypothetical protein
LKFEDLGKKTLRWLWKPRYEAEEGGGGRGATSGSVFWEGDKTFFVGE